MIDKLSKDEAPDDAIFNAFLNKVDFQIDQNYLNFIKKHNGSHVSFDNEYFALWKIEDVIALNPRHKDDPECYNWFFFATDGSNTGYAFDKVSGNVLEIDYIEFEPVFIARSFVELLTVLSQR